MVRLSRISKGEFKLRIGRLFGNEEYFPSRIEIARESIIYESGEPGTTIYFIRKGRVELLLPGMTGPDFPLSSRSEGEIFGESCLSGQLMRLENAFALEDTILEEMPASNFLAGLRENGLLEDFVGYLSECLGIECQIIESLALRGGSHHCADASSSRGPFLSGLFPEQEPA
jgi:CRP-like cAMP-binding protein